MKKRIMIDMDNVITDGTFKEQIEDFIGQKIDIEKTGYFLQNALEERKDEFFRRKPLDMYGDSDLINGAYEVIKELNKVYEIYVVTSYILPGTHYQEGNHLKYKMEYLQKKLPFLNTEQIIFINNKDLIDFDIRIDDSVKNLTKGETLLLFDSFLNQNVSKEELDLKNIKRVMNWYEIKEILLRER